MSLFLNKIASSHSFDIVPIMYKIKSTIKYVFRLKQSNYVNPWYNQLELPPWLYIAFDFDPTKNGYQLKGIDSLID